LFGLNSEFSKSFEQDIKKVIDKIIRIEEGEFISIKSLDRKQKPDSYNNVYIIRTEKNSYFVYNKNIGRKNEVILATITPDGQVSQKRVDKFDSGRFILAGDVFYYNPKTQKVLFWAFLNRRLGISLLEIIGKKVKTYKT